MTKKTSLHSIHESLGARLVDFAGWELPVQYEGILAEHKHCRTATSLFDTCHMGQMIISGPNAAKELSSALTQDACALPVGRCKYGFILNEAGGVIDDQILMRLGENEFFLVVNAATAGHDHEIVRERLSAETQMIVPQNAGKLDIQGPTSAAALAPLVKADISEMKYFSVCRTKIMGVDCILSRTGYTGELGWEVYMDNDHLPALMQKLLEVEDVKPAGLGARDSLRLEMAMALYGHELSEEITPLEANLGFFVDLDRDFVGVEALRKNATPDRKLVHLTTDQRRRFNTGDKIFAGEEEIGTVTSGVFSPSLSYAIGLGFVHSDIAKPGAEVFIKTARADIKATLTEGPFYKEGTCRKKLG